MKYMTKEWYETMQRTDFHLLLKVSKKAETFSEDYFRKLYKSEEKAWLKLHEDASKVKFEDIFPEEFHVVNIDGTPLDSSEYEEAKRKYFEMREQARINFMNIPQFDPEKEKENFKQSFLNNVKRLKSSLPDEILRKVADIRVLALNRASASVKNEIAAYCRANKRAAERAMKTYYKEYQKNFKNGEPEFAKNFNFHDCKVISCRKRGNDVVITLDNSGGFTDLNQIIFKDCLIIKQDIPLHGAIWLYDEIYKSDNGYEIYVLLLKKELIDFIVTTADVKYR